MSVFSIQQGCSGGKFNLHLNVRKLSAGDSLSLHENVSLLTPSSHFSTNYIYNKESIRKCQLFTQLFYYVFYFPILIFFSAMLFCFLLFLKFYPLLIF
jgi:hypothetical protein